MTIILSNLCQREKNKHWAISLIYNINSNKTREQTVLNDQKLLVLDMKLILSINGVNGVVQGKMGQKHSEGKS